MDSVTNRELQKTAANVRLGILEEVFNAASGHPGGSLSIADVITYLYFAEMNVRTDDPNWDDRDRFVLSKGHTCPALYAVLAEKGFFPKEDLKTFRHNGDVVDAFCFQAQSRAQTGGTAAQHNGMKFADIHLLQSFDVHAAVHIDHLTGGVGEVAADKCRITSLEQVKANNAVLLDYVACLRKLGYWPDSPAEFDAVAIN